jgi:hypothetical protein
MWYAIALIGVMMSIMGHGIVDSNNRAAVQVACFQAMTAAVNKGVEFKGGCVPPPVDQGHVTVTNK